MLVAYLWSMALNMNNLYCINLKEMKLKWNYVYITFCLRASWKTLKEPLSIEKCWGIKLVIMRSSDTCNKHHHLVLKQSSNYMVIYNKMWPDNNVLVSKKYRKLPTRPCYRKSTNVAVWVLIMLSRY